MLTDRQQRTFHIMEREDGSVCVYYTRCGLGVHFVVWDELDGQADLMKVCGRTNRRVVRNKRQVERQ